MTSSYIMVTRTPIDPKLIDSNYTTWTLNRFFSKVTYITSIEKQSSKRLVVLESENHNPIKNCKTQAHSFWGWKPCIQIAATALIAVWSNNPHYFQHVCIYIIHNTFVFLPPELDVKVIIYSEYLTIQVISKHKKVQKTLSTYGTKRGKDAAPRTTT